MKPPGPLNRKVPLKPGGPLKSKAKRMKAVSGNTRLDLERYPDAFGVYFDEVESILPGHSARWPKARLVPNRPKVGTVLRSLFGSCFVCGVQAGGGIVLDWHHLIGGSRGRSDELTNAMLLCRHEFSGDGCHAKYQSVPALFGFLLYRKWKLDREHLSWVRLALLKRELLPELIVEA